MWRCPCVIQPTQVKDRRADECHTRDLIRVHTGIAQTDRRAKRMSYQGSFGDTHLLHKIVEKLNLILEIVPLRVLAAVAKSPQVKCVRPVFGTELLHGGNPVTPRSQPTVYKNDRATTAQNFVVYKVIFDGYGAHQMS